MLLSLLRISIPELNYNSDSQPRVTAGRGCGGVQQVILLAFHFMPRGPTVNGALITSFHLTPPHSEVLSVPDLHSYVKAIITAVPTSHVEGWDDLPSTLEEAKTVVASVPEGTLIALQNPEDSLAMAGEGISAQKLLTNLPDATILDLACHGHHDSENALKSGFVMNDKILTIESLIPVPLPHAFMAFMSACETAKGDEVSLHSVLYA
jgi:CHAT domain-containing protein